MIVLILSLLLLSPLTAWSAGNQPINPIPSTPWASGADTKIKTWQSQEIPAITGRYFPQDWVFRGGVHGTAGGCTSDAFATEAFTSAGTSQKQSERVMALSTDQSASSTVAIPYGSMGCNCTDDIAWVIISSASGNSLDNFTRVGSSNYFVNCTDTQQPSLPAQSAWLMQVTLSGGAITAVTDKRKHCPMEGPTRVTYVSCLATGGDGSVNNPWTGWASAVNWTGSDRTYYFANGYYDQGSTAITVTGIDPGTATGRRIEIHAGAGAQITTDISSGAAWTFGKTPTDNGGQNQIYVIDGLNILGTNTTDFKVALDFLDVSQVHISNIRVPDPQFGGWTGDGSIYLRLRGRELIVVEKSTIGADRPIYVAGATQVGFGGNMDILQFKDVFAISGDKLYPVVTFDPDVYAFQISFDNFTCQRGSDCIYAVVEAQIQWQFFIVHNMRWETATAQNQTGHCLRIEFGGVGLPFGVQNLTNFYAANLWCEGTNTHKGVKLRSVQFATLINYSCDGADGTRSEVCLDIGNADDSEQNYNVQHLTLINTVLHTSSDLIKGPHQVVVQPGIPDDNGDRGITDSGPGITHIQYFATLPTPTAWDANLHCSTGGNVHTYDTVLLPPDGWQGSYQIFNIGGVKWVHFDGIFSVTALDGTCGGDIQFTLPLPVASNGTPSSVTFGYFVGIEHSAHPAYTITCAAIPAVPATPSCTAALNTGIAGYTNWMGYIESGSNYVKLREEGNGVQAVMAVGSINVPLTISYSGWYVTP